MFLGLCYSGSSSEVALNTNAQTHQGLGFRATAEVANCLACSEAFAQGVLWVHDLYEL